MYNYFIGLFFPVNDTKDLLDFTGSLNSNVCISLTTNVTLDTGVMISDICVSLTSL